MCFIKSKVWEPGRPLRSYIISLLWFLEYIPQPPSVAMVGSHSSLGDNRLDNFWQISSDSGLLPQQAILYCRKMWSMCLLHNHILPTKTGNDNGPVLSLIFLEIHLDFSCKPQVRNKTQVTLVKYMPSCLFVMFVLLLSCCYSTTCFILYLLQLLPINNNFSPLIPGVYNSTSSGGNDWVLFFSSRGLTTD